MKTQSGPKKVRKVRWWVWDAEKNLIKVYTDNKEWKKRLSNWTAAARHCKYFHTDGTVSYDYILHRSKLSEIPDARLQHYR